MRVLLLRSPVGAEPYLEAFAARGVEAEVVDVVGFRFLNASDMTEALANPEDYSGLVVLSPRTADAWRRDDQASRLLEGWAHLPTYVAGPRTAREAQSLGLSPIRATTDGATALAEHLTEVAPAKPLLFCCGKPPGSKLVASLEAAGVEVHQIPVYASDLDRKPPAGPPPDGVVFFSARSLGVRDYWDWPWHQIRVGVVGDSTSRQCPEADARAAFHEVAGLVDAMV